MDTSDTLRFIYLGILVAVIAGGLLLRSRGRMGQTLKNALVWALVIGGTAFGIGAFQGANYMPFATQATLEDGRIELVMQPDGHYYMTAAINGKPVEFVVDTGASQVVLTQEDARRVGLNPADLDFIGSANTANGLVQTAPVRLETVQVGDMIDKNVRAVVNGGKMDGSLLGMTYLNRFEKIEISRGRLILTR